jgi:hypothetical protein
VRSINNQFWFFVSHAENYQLGVEPLDPLINFNVKISLDARRLYFYSATNTDAAAMRFL